MTRGDLQEVAACNGLSENEAIDAILDSIKTPLAVMAIQAWKRNIMPMNWEGAEKHLFELMEAYMPGQVLHIIQLKVRLEGGERTRALYDAIMAMK